MQEHFRFVLSCLSLNSIFDAVFQVYNTYSNAEYDRHNEDIDPVSASAEFELEKRVETMDVFAVEIEKGEKLLSLSVYFLLIWLSICVFKSTSVMIYYFWDLDIQWHISERSFMHRESIVLVKQG